MAIISAGVIMNLIFALLAAIAAFGLFGVRQPGCGVGQVIPGGGAWQAGLRTGDQIVEIDGQPVTIFKDLMEKIVLGDVSHAVPIVVNRPGVKEPLSFQVKTLDIGGRPGISITPPWDPVLLDEKGEPATMPGFPASQCNPPLAQGDRLEMIDQRPIHTPADVNAALAANTDRPLRVEVRRKKSDKTLEISVAPRPMRWLGVVMEMGPVTAIQNGSPADGPIQVGDVIRTLDGVPAGDPLTLPARVARRGTKEIVLGIQRGKEKKEKKLLEVRLHGAADAQWDPSATENSPVALPGLGLCYRVLNRVAAVAADGPAAHSGLQSGDTILGATILPPDKEQIVALREKYKEPDLDQDKRKLEFDEQRHDWPCLTHAIQAALPGTTVQLAWSHEGAANDAKLALVDAADWFNSDRGFLFEPQWVHQIAHSFVGAVSMGGRETLNSALVVYGSLQKVGTGQVSLRNFGGPVTIFRMALGAAEEGMGALLLFMTLLSANLAVINFLPIPVLDGGHFVLLAWEGIRGKPADERVQIALAYAGLILIVALMIFVFGLDFGLISRPGPGH